MQATKEKSTATELKIFSKPHIGIFLEFFEEVYKNDCKFFPELHQEMRIKEYDSACKGDLIIRSEDSDIFWKYNSKYLII